MTLPNTRNTSYTPASQILSADLNAIQDNIIGNKHPLLEEHLDCSGMRGDVAALGSINAAGYITAFSAGGTVRGNVRVPVGKRIVHVIITYSVNNTAQAITPKLRKIVDATGVQSDVVAGVADSTGGAGVIENQDLTANHVVLAGNTYFVETSIINTNHRIMSAAIFYDSL